MTLTGLIPMMSLVMTMSGGQAATAAEPCGTGNCQPAIERLCPNGVCAQSLCPGEPCRTPDADACPVHPCRTPDARFACIGPNCRTVQADTSPAMLACGSGSGC